MAAKTIVKTPISRTTVRLPTARLDRAKEYAAKRGITLTELIDQGISLAMKHSPKPGEKGYKLPVGRAADGIGKPLIPIDFNNSAQLWEILDEADRLEKEERAKQWARNDSAGR